MLASEANENDLKEDESYSRILKLCELSVHLIDRVAEVKLSKDVKFLLKK